MLNINHVNESSASIPRRREMADQTNEPQDSTSALIHVNTRMIAQLSAIEARLQTLESGAGTPSSRRTLARTQEHLPAHLLSHPNDLSLTVLAQIDLIQTVLAQIAQQTKLAQINPMQIGLNPERESP
ncbi:hypothetical protein L211DRAFT_850001 [Terfezia boudieri ATCC MYA-4762]|uniref:Uncharacterized protein n=1 Tax=Terfezia boudieri ATCC MYA-4762 TaxID=1051890 RepID=A0A3N4LN78_9PEZI|nr:hypothetical protein L211DRAFT_850001 [Terfezia boudieri ATCC MYA-4762]